MSCNKIARAEAFSGQVTAREVTARGWSPAVQRSCPRRQQATGFVLKAQHHQISQCNAHIVL